MYLVIVHLLHYVRALVLSDQLEKHSTTCALITEICRGGGALYRTEAGPGSNYTGYLAKYLSFRLEIYYLI